MKNGRVVFVGNGISLQKTDMDLLIGETTFAMNRIHMHYDKTIWRPTYYIAIDCTAGTWVADCVIHIELGEKVFTDPRVAEGIYNQVKKWRWPVNVTILPMCKHHAMNHLSDGIPTEWHLPVICRFGTGLSAMVQLAVLMGYKGPYYFVGCDLGFVEPPRYEADPNHFHPAYGTHDDFPIEDRDDTLIYTHEIIKRELDQQGIENYNATVGGKLEVHPRRDYYKVFGENNV